MMLTVKIRNIPQSPRKLVVARLIDGELWYYADFDEEDRDRAERCKEEINGIIAEVM